MTMTIVPEEEHECDAVPQSDGKTTAAVLDVTMDIVEDASDADHVGKSLSKKRSLNDISENESNSSSNNKKKACTGLPRRVSTIAGDGSTEAIADAASASIVMAPPLPPANNTVGESRRPIIRRVSDYLDDVRRSSLLMVAGQVGEKRNRAGRNGRASDGTATPGLVTPSSSFLVGSIDPAIVAVQEEEGANFGDDAIIQREECEDDEKEKSLGDEQSADTAHAASNALVAPKAKASEPTVRNQPQSTWKTMLFHRILPLLILIEAALLVAERVFDLPFDPTFSLHEAPIHPDSVYVPGAGFSGYWFTLGRLKSIPDPASKSYYCYSAGCLGVVATLAGKSMHEMSDLAFGVQRRWKEGHLDRYDVVPHFVDGLLFDTAGAVDEHGSDAMKNVTAPVMSDAKLLSKINVITTIKDMVGVRSVIRTPRSIGELRDMLIHTTWIPWATGDGLWAKDALTGDHHMDGAFSATTHPRCTHHLGLPFMLDLFLNILNVNLGRDKVEKYWNAGIMLGL